MSKNITNRPGPQPAIARQQNDVPDDAPPIPGTKSASSSQKLKDKKQSQKVGAARPQRSHRGRGLGAGHVAGAHQAHDDEVHGGGPEMAIGEMDSADRHRHRGADELAAELMAEERHVEEHEEAKDTGATGPDAITRSQGGQDSSDGFSQGEGQRETFERLLRGLVKSDDDRFAELRKKGVRDDFDPARPARDVEALGTPRACAHLVRLYDAWTLQGKSRAESVAAAAAWLADFSSMQNIRKVLAELESKPIRDVYPLEVLIHLLDHRPESLPGVKRGAIVGNAADLASGDRVFAGHAVPVTVPADVRLKSFALLGGGRPGYEFHPTAGDDKRYTLLIDTPGRFRLAILAAPLQQLGRIQKESGEGIIEILDVTVHAMGKKGEPVTPEQWWAEQQLARDSEEKEEEEEEEDSPVDANGSDDRPASSRPSVGVSVAALLIQQIRSALDAIVRDEGSASTATTYSWDVTFWKPNAAMLGQPILHLVVDRAGPFDPVWIKAREAIAHKQLEYEPGRALITQQDVVSALQRARVR